MIQRSQLRSFVPAHVHSRDNVSGLEQELFGDSLNGVTSEEGIAIEFIDARLSIATAICDGSQLGAKLQAVFTDLLVTSIKLCGAVDCRLAGLKALGQTSYFLVVADVCRAYLDADAVPLGTQGAT